MNEIEIEAEVVVEDFKSGRYRVMVHAFPDVSQFGAYRDTIFGVLGDFIHWKPERQELVNMTNGLMLAFPRRAAAGDVRGVIQKTAEEALITILEGKSVPTDLAIEASQHVHIVDKNDENGR